MNTTETGPDYNAAVASELRAERAALGITVPTLSARTGLPVSTLERYLSGRAQITLNKLVLIVSGLETTTNTILRRAEERIDME